MVARAAGISCSMSSAKPRALILRAPGTNCDRELCRAFELAGASVEVLHIDRVCARPGDLERFELIGFPGGFSYGDDIASGRVLAMKVRLHLYGALREAVERGACVIGVCNGFQVLCQAGLLPGPTPGEPWPETPPAPTVSLAENAGGRFIDAWEPVRFEPGARCVWTAGIEPAAGAGDHHAAVYQLPIAHGEGRLIADMPETIAALEASGRVALRYGRNLNGSENAIAGICDASGRVLGLMPHPERYLDWTRHPFWTRLPESVRREEPPGLRMFRGAVEAVSRQPA